MYREELKKIERVWFRGAKRNSLPYLPAFLGSYGSRKFCIHYGP